ncbi:MAG: glycosyltransferase family 4 protein [Chloroflexi bacterium]|nr:glycosyltransferase family 4 protein [Chloroflexota bacterium]
MHIGINAHLLSFGTSYRGAGISRYIRSTVSHLRHLAGDDEYSVFLGDPNLPPEFSPGARFRPVISRLPTARPVVRILWEQLILPLELISRDIDVLHSTGYVQPFACSRRSVVTVHDLSFELFPEAFNRANRLYLGAFTRFSVRRADRIIAVSENTKRDLVRLLGAEPEKIDVIYHGVETFFRPIDDAVLLDAFRREHQVPEHYILFVGTLEPRKNLKTLVAAFARLKRAGFPHKLVIGGAKGWRWGDVFATVEELGLAQEVVFIGYVDLARQPLWYNCADLFAYPSVYEGFGFPVLEAMACGTPVVTSRAASLPEVVGEAGQLVDPTDASAMAEAMVRVLVSPDLRQEMREKGLERASSFSWHEAARQTRDTYTRCLK